MGLTDGNDRLMIIVCGLFATPSTSKGKVISNVAFVAESIRNEAGFDARAAGYQARADQLVGWSDIGRLWLPDLSSDAGVPGSAR